MRFPEFEGAWERKKLGDIATNIMYGMNAAAKDYDGENQYIRITDINEKSRLFSPNPLSSPDSELDNKYILDEGDILFARTGASVGKSYLYNRKDGKIFFAGFLIRLNVKIENPYFIFLQTLTEKYQKWVITMSMRSGQPGINAEEYKLYPIVVPTIHEQNKISSFLALLDERIQTQIKIIEQLETLIKSISQKLFTQKIRFKEFSKDWENKLFRDVLIEPQQIPVEKPENIELLTVKLHCKGIINSGNYPTITRNGRPYYKRFKNEILIGRQNFHNGGIGIVNEQNSGKICSNAISSYNVISDNLLFVYYYISRPKYYMMINDLIGGTGQKEITKSELSRLKINLPSLEEQNRIASFLSKIDQKIETEKSVLQQLEKQKKYLLKQMFV